MSPSALARLAELHGQLSALYAELAAEPAPFQPAERALGLNEAAAMLGCSRAKRERGPRR